MNHFTDPTFLLPFSPGEPLPSQPDGDRHVHRCSSRRIGTKVPRIGPSQPISRGGDFEQLGGLYEEPQRLSGVEGATRVDVRRGLGAGKKKQRRHLVAGCAPMLPLFCLRTFVSQITGAQSGIRELFNLQSRVPDLSNSILSIHLLLLSSLSGDVANSNSCDRIIFFTKILRLIFIFFPHIF